MRVPLFVGLTIALAIPISSAEAAGFNCSASAGRVGALGASAIELVTANVGAAECVAETRTLTGAASGLPAPVSAGAVVAATEVYSTEKGVLASGGLADLRVLSLPTLPITLPQVTVPAALKSLSVSLTAVKDVLDPLHLGLDPVVNAIPSTVTVDASAAVQSLLPGGKLPNVELLHVRGAMAYAVGVCKDGSPTVDGASQVSGISVLGQDLPVGQIVDKTVGLIDTASIDPSQANLAAINLGLPAAVNTLISTVPAAQTAVASAIQKALDDLGSLKVLDPTLAQIKITPGTTVTSGLNVTQQALTVTVTIAGQKLVDAVVGEAKASAAGVDCSAPVTDPGTPTGATLKCSTRRLVLVDVLERAGRVKLFGVADPALAGRTVAIVFGATGDTVAHAKVDKDGSFDTTAPLPPANVRDTNAARYTAKLGKEKSINLKLRRRMIVQSMTSHNGKVTIVGRVVPPLGRPLQPITLKQRVSCNDDKVVGHFRPHRDGSFRITVKAPTGGGTAVYRLTTQVRNSPTGHAMFKTYTLPRAVELQR